MAALDTFKTLLAGAAPPADSVITALMDQADLLISGYLRLPAVPGGLDGARASLALALYNRMGAEGEQKHMEGEITSVYEAIPRSVLLALRPYRFAAAPSLLTPPEAP